MALRLRAQGACSKATGQMFLSSLHSSTSAQVKTTLHAQAAAAHLNISCQIGQNSRAGWSCLNALNAKIEGVPVLKKKKMFPDQVWGVCGEENWIPSDW